MDATAETHNILLVEDDQTLLETLEYCLTAAGESVEAYGSFAQGRAALRARKFDALLTDVRLGAFNGLQLALIARETQPEIHIVVFSGYEDAVLRDEAASIGADYLVKPVTGDQLCAALRRSPRRV